MTRPGIEPQPHGPLANTQLIRPMAWIFLKKQKKKKQFNLRSLSLDPVML